ncbi:MAG: tetratricopeptide repeat protein [Magnetococcus sp. DMHC-6]
MSQRLSIRSQPTLILLILFTLWFWLSIKPLSATTDGQAIPLSLGAAWDNLRSAAKSFGPNDPRTLPALVALSNLYLSLNRYAEAEPLVQHATNIVQQSQGATAFDILPHWIQMARIDAHYHRYSLAEELYKNALGLVIKKYGATHALAIQLQTEMSNIKNPSFSPTPPPD